MTPALLVLAGTADRSARDFVARQAARGAVLVTPRDLSRPGWRLRVGDPAASVAVAGDRRVPAREIAGVVTRIAAVTEADLPHIARVDRGYVAAEMTAFLLAFLTSLRVPVINRPVAECLCGPAWSAAKWRLFARQAGLIAAFIGKPAEAEQPSSLVTVIGGACLDAPEPDRAAAALALARMAGTDTLGVEFGADGAVLGAHLVPGLDMAGADAALLGLFGLREAA